MKNEASPEDLEEDTAIQIVFMDREEWLGRNTEECLKSGDFLRTVTDAGNLRVGASYFSSCCNTDPKSEEASIQTLFLYVNHIPHSCFSRITAKSIQSLPTVI